MRRVIDEFRHEDPSLSPTLVWLSDSVPHWLTSAQSTPRTLGNNRFRSVLNAEAGRSIVAAQKYDALPHPPVTQLQHDGAWSASAAA